jgi:hypothetical protein
MKHFYQFPSFWQEMPKNKLDGSLEAYPPPLPGSPGISADF